MYHYTSITRKKQVNVRLKLLSVKSGHFAWILKGYSLSHMHDQVALDIQQRC